MQGRVCAFLFTLVATTAGAAPQEMKEPPRKLAVGREGWFQPGLLLQGWFLVGRAGETTTTFRVRRAELHVKGEIVPDLVAYGLMIDPAKVLEFRDVTARVANQDPAPSDPANPESVTTKQPASPVSVFQDLFITFRMPYADISLGQFKIPVSWEGYNSSSKLLFAERAPVSREFGDKRDLGLRVSKTFEYAGYSAGLFNGSTLNNLDDNNAKDAALRLEVYPTGGLVIGGVVYASLWQRDEAGAKDRYEIDVRLERGPFLLQAEYVRARDVGSNATAVEARGFYAAFAYKLFDVIEPCVRIGHLDPDIGQDLDPAAGKGKDELWHFDAGLNWYVHKNEVKLQLDYSRFQFEDKVAKDEIIFVAQVAF